MSTNSECQFIEYLPNQWYVFLENKNNGRGWDWRELAWCHGPFPDDALAKAYVRQNYTNPGGDETLTYEPQYSQDSELSRWIGEAKPLSEDAMEDLKAWAAWDSQPHAVKEAEHQRQMELQELIRRPHRIR